MGTHWFENGICVFGQDSGVIAAGLMLLRMVDPESQTPVPSAFGYKQVVHSTLMGGGFVTAMWLPLQKGMGLWGATLVTSVCFVVVLICWFVAIRPTFANAKHEEAERVRRESEQDLDRQAESLLGEEADAI